MQRLVDLAAVVTGMMIMEDYPVVGEESVTPVMMMRGQ